ncbi:MAG TPA: transposase [Burkholderiaceae bacterium]|nr:transposase [Burkholderiaceae bacterium]
MDTKGKASRGVKQERRRHSAAFKRRLIEQTLAPGVSVARIALENGVNTNLLFKWRRDHIRTHRVESPTLLPVAINEPSAESTPISPPAARVVAGGVIEIELAGARIRLKGSIDLAALRVTLQMLSPTPA